VANTLILLGAFLPIYHLCWHSLGQARLTVLSAGFAVLALAGVYSNVRPQTVSFLFFALFYWVLLRYSRGERASLWILPLLMALWVNLHGAFVLGLGLILLILLSETTRRVIIGNQAGTLPGRNLWRLFLVFLATILASFINPENYGVYEYVLTVLRDPGSQVYVSEWQPPSIKSFSGLVCFHGPFFLSLVMILYSRRRLTLTELLIYIGFAAFGLSSLRNGVWFSLIVPPIVAKQLANTRLSEQSKKSRLYQFWIDLRSGDSSRRSTAPAAVALVILIGCIASTPWLQPSLTGEPLWEPETPVGAVDFIEAEQLKGNIFHAQAYGDYLVWRIWPEQKSFVDGRVHLFGGELIEEYRSILHDSSWIQRLEAYDIQYLFLRVSTESEQNLRRKAIDSGEWELLYEDGLSVILGKKSR
jgi:hypothetical protein